MTITAAPITMESDNDDNDEDTNHNRTAVNETKKR